MRAATGTVDADNGSAARARRWFVRLAAARPSLEPVSVSVVIPVTRAERVERLLESLAIACPERAPEVVVVDARDHRDQPLRLADRLEVRVVPSDGGGGAIARNAGMRACIGEWVVVLDEDQVVGNSWYDELLTDLGRAGRAVAGVAARAGSGRPDAARLGADVAYRRLVALSLGGFQARFPRGTGHDELELAQRMTRAGWSIVLGSRRAADVQIG